MLVTQLSQVVKKLHTRQLIDLALDKREMYSIILIKTISESLDSSRVQDDMGEEGFVKYAVHL